MIFRQIDEIKRGRKTMTQRVVKDGELPVIDEAGAIVAVRAANGRDKWRIGRSYALVPKRGAHGVGFIRLLKIERVSVRNMDQYDAWREGVSSVAEYAALWDRINRRKGTRWADNPMVWRLTFEVAQ
jgi:hypothetical protein